MTLISFNPSFVRKRTLCPMAHLYIHILYIHTYTPNTCCTYTLAVSEYIYRYTVYRILVLYNRERGDEESDTHIQFLYAVYIY
jgi:hypothetical protein